MKLLLVFLLMGCSPVRIATFNIANGAGFVLPEHRQAQRALLSELDLDIIALQEVDMGATRSGYVDTAKESVPDGYKIQFANALDFEDDPYIPDDVGQYGLAIASRLPMERIEVNLLPGSSGHLGFIVQTVQIGPYRVMNTHLHWGDKRIRKAQIQAIRQLLLPNSVVLGDFNQTEVDLLNQATPQGLIDIIQTNHPTGDSGVVYNEASDHPVVFAEILP